MEAIKDLTTKERRLLTIKLMKVENIKEFEVKESEVMINGDDFTEVNEMIEFIGKLDGGRK